MLSYARDEMFTYCGTVLVSVNPYKSLPCFGPKDIRRYTGARLGKEPPHIFATAEACMDNIRTGSGDQSVIISGESGAGKTESTRRLVQYLAAVTVSRSAERNWVMQQVSQIHRGPTPSLSPRHLLCRF